VEVVLDLATAVGKTYIAAGLIDYVAELGVRNIVVITPSRAILTKTVNNFTRGHPKSIKDDVLHRSSSPVMTSSAERSARPRRRQRRETLRLHCPATDSPQRESVPPGTRLPRGPWQGLYDFYDRSATSWSSQTSTTRTTDRRSQTPSASSTRRPSSVSPRPELPNEAGRDHLPLHAGQAIADGLVKVPMLVGRKDDRRDTETQLADGWSC